MKYLGIDYGAKRVGTAVSDGDGTIAFPRESIPNDEKLLSCIVGIIEREKIGTVVIGDTRSMSGKDNPITPEAERFTRELGERVDIPIKPAFEMWSSIEASRYSQKESEHNDAAAASIILQRFLDMQGRSNGRSPEHE